MSGGSHSRTTTVGVIVVLGFGCLGLSVSSYDPARVTFAEVGQIFEDNCVSCHSGPKAPKGLRLNSLENVLRGSENGPVIKTGDPQGSELVRRLRGLSSPRMPLSGPPWLDEEEIRLIEEWIMNGTPNDNEATAESPLSTAPTQTIHMPDTIVTFRQVEPIFKMHCVKCHNTRGLMGAPPEGLVLSSYDGIIAGTERVYVVPGNPDGSELVRKLRGQSLPRMPFDGPPYLDDDLIALIEQWVVDGARDESGQRAPIPAGRKVRLRGRLSAEWSLDGLPLEFGRSDRKNKVSVGDYVEVRGRVTRDGAISTQRLTPRNSSQRNADD